ncbi:MAG TPA: M28 family peptidase [Bryobacteraceae bacterium]|nr:M28 family peptidase [Bryobacteraceae bacterium]
MRRVLISAGVAAVAASVWFSVAPGRAAAQSKGKAAKSAPAPAYGNSDAISQDELKVYDYFLASDTLEGRNFPSRGYDAAALYVASHLAEWHLKPGGSAEGTDGPLQPYLMPIEMVAKQVTPEESKLTLSGVTGGGRGGFGGGGQGGGNAEPRTLTFEYGKEWSVGGFGGRGSSLNAMDVSANLVFAGHGYVIHKSNTDPYQGIDVKGKIIIVAGQPPELAGPQGGGRGGRGGRGAANGGAAADAQPAAGGRGALAALGEACTDYMTPEQYAARNGALAVITIPSFQQLAAAGGGFGAGGRGAGLNGPNYQVVKFRQGGACPSAPAISAGLDLTNALFQGEKLSGSQVFYAAGTNEKLDSFELNARKKMSIKLAVKETPGHGENVVGILEGSDPVLKNEYVIMSAHLDHIGLSAPLPDGHNVNNGADDDGSGSTGLLGIAHAYAEGAAKGIRPRRSIIFLWNGGEEKGLLGSQYFAEFPPVDLTKVVADLNMDMIGRTLNPNSVDPNKQHVLVKRGEVLLIGPNISSDDLERTIETVNNGYQKLTLNHFYDVTKPDDTHDNLGPAPNGQRIFYRSDHYNFAKVGIPIAFFTTGLHVDYHRPTDTPDKIDYEELQIIAKTVSAVGWQLANQDGRPKLNTNLPEQLTKDMKTAQTEGWGKTTPVLPPLKGEPQ